MARRRPGDADNYPAEDDLPLPSTADLTNGKSRTPAEKAGRFFRTRPVSSLLITITICVMAMITFSIGRYVGRGVVKLFSTSSKSTNISVSTTHSDSDSDVHAHEHHSKAQQFAKTWKKPGGDEDHRDADEDDDDDDDDNGNKDTNDNDDTKQNRVADDEKGTLVDGVSGSDPVQPNGDKPVANKTHAQQPSHSQHCYRKFEPGKLGSPKMLCVTDEFFFDISIASTPVGRMKIGVFGEIVPKSAANFKSLATCTGVFADDSLCYRGDSFHRVVTNFVVQGGSKATGRSIYGPTFREEQSKDHHSFLEHSERGVVSWAEYPIGSQFFILTRDEGANYLDGNHVVFGVVTEGDDVLQKIHDAPRSGEEPLSRITITDCGDVHK